MQNEQSKKSLSKPSKPVGAKELSLNRLMKQSRSKQNYKGYDVRLVKTSAKYNKTGWLSLARKGNLLVAGVDPKGNVLLHKDELSALHHICSLIDLSEETTISGLDPETIADIFHD